MTFTQILPFASFAALPLLAGALWLLNRTGFLAAGTKHLFSAAAGLLAAFLVILWMVQGNFPGDIPVAMLYRMVLAGVQAWSLSAAGAGSS